MTDQTGFLDALRRQQEKYRELAAVAAEQNRVLGSGDVDALLGVVERKRAIMGEIEEIEKAVVPARGRWADARDTLDARAVREVEGAVAETKKILRELVRLEDEARDVIESRRPSAAEDLRRVLAARRARGAYGVS